MDGGGSGVDGTTEAFGVNAVPVRTLDYKLVRKVKPLDQRENDMGLVLIHVDASNIGVGWIIAQ